MVTSCPPVSHGDIFYSFEAGSNSDGLKVGTHGGGGGGEGCGDQREFIII